MEKALHKLVWSRADACCEYCQLPQRYDPLPFQIDHVIARQHGGATAAENLALTCYACNHHKGPNIAGFDHVTQQTIPLYHPRRDSWKEHFRWSGPILEGMTPLGRVTVHVLAINLDYRVALRRALLHEGVFPDRNSV
ncbi:MAG: HNH endonuclease [Planctomycetes bacterium]|nr:HNH endonuclease [Planctomycetota bacterium]